LLIHPPMLVIITPLILLRNALRQAPALSSTWLVEPLLLIAFLMVFIYLYFFFFFISCKWFNTSNGLFIYVIIFIYCLYAGDCPTDYFYVSSTGANHSLCGTSDGPCFSLVCLPFFIYFFFFFFF
jgi:hypothetical protein